MLGLVSGLAAFFFDLSMALLMQRFFMATNVLPIGTSIPLGIKLYSPAWEGSALILAGICRAGIIWLNGYLAGLCQASIEAEKRGQLAEWGLSSGNQEVGQIMSYFNDIIVGSAVSVGNIFYILSRFVLLSGLLGVLLYSSLSITLFFIVFLLLMAPFQYLIDKVISRNSEIIQKSLSNSVSQLSKAVKNNLFLSLHNLIGWETVQIKSMLDSYKNASTKYYLLSNLRGVIPQVAGLIVIVFIAIQGRAFFQDNPASLLAYLYLVLRFVQVLSDLARMTISLRLNYPRLKILYEWWLSNINGISVQPHSEIKSDSVILKGWRAEEVSFVWPDGKRTAIDRLSFQIAPGTTSLIIGRSGSGKTTLFYILLGLLSPTSGRVFQVDTNGRQQILLSRVREIVSYVGPDPFLIAGSIRDQLKIGNKNASDEDLVEVLKLVNADFVFEFSEGLGHHLTEQGEGLSAGQKQRLALARAILRKPSILLLDEATANLDEKTEGAIIKLINSFQGSMTILVISHRPHADLKVSNQINLNGKLD